VAEIQFQLTNHEVHTGLH